MIWMIFGIISYRSFKTVLLRSMWSIALWMRLTPLSSIADVGTDYRFLVSGNYMVFYRVQDSDVHIDRVLYGRSDYMSALFKDLLREKTTE